MARIEGVDLPANKRVDIALSYIFGIGRSTALKIVQAIKLTAPKKSVI
jgi:small subunit ribosomal protein S13